MAETVHMVKESIMADDFQIPEFTAPEDKLVDTWLMMSSPVPILTTVGLYLYFVLHLGPKLMENRKPFDLKYLLIGYNFYNVVLSSYLVWQIIGDWPSMMHIYEYQCVPMDRRKNPFLYKINSGSWIYFFSKVIELADTVFFVLRKKQSQVTVLHVYHHANMAVSTWAYLKYIRGEQGLLIGFVNSFVHVVMYSYYLLAALGPQVQKYLWWKRYITKLQLGQFVFILCYCMYLLVKDCQFPKGLTYYAAFQTSVFFFLFMNFYRKTYTSKKNKEEPVKEKLKSS